MSASTRPRLSWAALAVAILAGCSSPTTSQSTGAATDAPVGATTAATATNPDAPAGAAGGAKVLKIGVDLPTGGAGRSAADGRPARGRAGKRQGLAGRL